MFKALRMDFNDKLSLLNKNLNRISIPTSRMATPQQQIDNTTTAALNKTEATTTVKLGGNPGSLHELRHEFQFGVGDRKAAKDFSKSEGGGINKFKYCIRKVFWDIFIIHFAAGYKANVAIEKKIRGGHPNLQIN
jgi:hypothetical protein